jgi:uncharacterized membrane protein
METIKESIDVNVPVGEVYNRWTQFEQFPKFMEGVESVIQIDDTHLRWAANVGGVRCDWGAEIVEQVPDERIAWRATSGNGPNGIVTFEPLGPDSTLITVEMAYEPNGLMEQVGAKAGIDSRQVTADLKSFKQLVETMSAETGAWRGEVHAGERRS